MSGVGKRPPVSTAMLLLQGNDGQAYLKKLWADAGPNKDQPRVWDTGALLVRKWLRDLGHEIPEEQIALVPNAAKAGYKVLLGEDVNVLVVDELDEDEDLPANMCSCAEAKRNG